MCNATNINFGILPISLLTHIYTYQGFIQDFRFGGETQHLGGSGGMFPQEIFLRLILGNFLVHMHILAKCKNCKIDVFCCNYAINTEWILGGKCFGGRYPRSPPPCMNPCLS